MNRLAYRVLAGFLGIIVVTVVGVSAMSFVYRTWVEDPMDHLRPDRSVARWVARSLPPPGAPIEEYAHRVQELQTDAGGALAVFEGGQLVFWGGAGEPPAGLRCDWRGPTGGRNWHGFCLRLHDHRGVLWVAPDGNRAGRHLGFVSLLLVVVAILLGGTWLIARWIARDYARIGDSVSRWGTGQLDVRALEEGPREVRRLARGFNQAADQVEMLVRRQREVLAHTSHELRTPLTRMRLAAELMQDVDDGNQRHLAALQSNIDELDQLVDDLLLVARMQAGDTAKLPLEAIDLVELLQQEDVVLPAGTARAVVRGNRGLLRRLVRNLVENARKHADSEPEVRIHVQEDSLEIEVSDQGPGLAPEVADTLFDPFVRAGDASGGTGLGLFIALRAAEWHGGTILSRPNEPDGTVFVVQLPLRD